MKTIDEADLPNENVDDVVWFEHLENGTVNLHTLSDPEGFAIVISQRKRQASSEMEVEMRKRENAFDTPENNDIRDAAFAGVGHRGRSIVETKQKQKDIIVGKMAVQDLRESKKSEIENATTIEDVAAITW